MMTRHTGAVMPLADAEDMLTEVRGIMAEQQLNYGPAVDEYIRRHVKVHSSTAMGHRTCHD